MIRAELRFLIITYLDGFLKLVKATITRELCIMLNRVLNGAVSDTTDVDSSNQMTGVNQLILKNYLNKKPFLYSSAY